MAGQTVCPRCGARNSFMRGYLPETCVCRVCQSQLDWREIPGCGPDCRPADAAAADKATESSVAADGSADALDTSDQTPASGSDA